MYVTTATSTNATNTTVWKYWSNDTSATTTATTQASTWGQWASGTTETTVWRTWTNDTTSGTYEIVTQPRLQVPTRTPEQVSAQLDAERQARTVADQQWKDHQAKQQAAKAKAERLLGAHLNAEQAQAWKENRAIFVTAKSGRRFKIKEGRAGNIEEVNAEGTPIRHHCVHVAPGDIPDVDNVLAQKLALEYNEEMIMRLSISREIRA